MPLKSELPKNYFFLVVCGTLSTETSWVQSLTHRTILDSIISIQGEKYGQGMTAVKQVHLKPENKIC